MAKASKSEETRDLIAEVAMRHFAEHGFGGASIGGIAREAEVSKALVFFHFDSKEGLFREVLNRFVEACISELVGLGMHETEPAGQLRELIRSYRAFISKRPDFMRMFLGWFLRRGRVEATGPEPLLALYEQFRGVLAGVLGAGVEQGAFRADLDLDVTAHTIVAGLTGLFVQIRVEPSALEVEDQLYETFTENLLRGLAAP